MALTIVNTSVVLAGQDYTPGLFSPDFLKSAKVANKAWELIEPPVATPVFSSVRYSNGVSILGEPGRIQVIDGKPSDDSPISRVMGIALKLLQKLTYVRHVAIGVNFAAIVEHNDPVQYLTDRFIKAGPWLDNSIEDFSLGFAYPIEETTINLTFSTGKAITAGQNSEIAGIGVSANFHTPIALGLTLEAATRSAQTAVNQAEAMQIQFIDLVNRTLELETTDE